MKLTAALAIIAASQAALASPVKRQATSTVSAVTPVPPIGTPSEGSTLLTAASSAVASIVESATATSGGIVPSASSSATPTYAFSCPSPYLLTYIEAQQNFDATIEAVLGVAGQWSDATYLGEISNNGQGNTVGATREVEFPVGVVTTETLTNYTTNTTTNAVFQQWTSPGTISFMNLTVGNYSAEQQVYVNDTNPSATTVKIFNNFCAIGQNDSATFLEQYVGAVFKNISIALGQSSSSSGVSSAAVPISTVSAASSEVATSTASASALSGTESPSATFSAAAATSTGNLLINTPASLTECQPAALTFSGGQGPYYLSILPGGQTSAPALEQFPVQQAAGVYTWTVNIPSGTAITLAIRDGTGAINYSSQITIQAGTSTACISA